MHAHNHSIQEAMAGELRFWIQWDFGKTGKEEKKKKRKERRKRGKELTSMVKFFPISSFKYFLSTLCV